MCSGYSLEASHEVLSMCITTNFSYGQKSQTKAIFYLEQSFVSRYVWVQGVTDWQVGNQGTCIGGLFYGPVIAFNSLEGK